VVLDTNIFIGHLAELTEMIERRHRSVVISVPWIVLQELDSLKSRRTSDLINKRAQSAINYLNGVLKSNAGGFLFENSVQVSLIAKKINVFSSSKIR
jgi:predicted ribonuclease YlaK